MQSFFRSDDVPERELYAPKKVPKSVQDLERLEGDEKFMEMATKIADLIKEYGTMPTPRQLKIRLGISARQMREVCGSIRNDPYDVLLKEAREILRKRDGVTVGFGRLETIRDNAPR